MEKVETNVVKPDVRFIENEIEQLILSNESETSLDMKIQEIENYMIDNNGKGKTDEEKDELYKNSQILWKELASVLRDTKYNFHMNRKQYQFLTDLLLKNLEYDVNTVFFAIELTDTLSYMRDMKFSNDTDLTPVGVNATEITYIYHLISNHKVKGLGRSAYLFSQILRRIGDISKVFNYYDTTAKNLATEIQDWVASWEEGVTREVKNVESEVIEGTVIESENK